MEGQRLDNFINYNLSCIENESYESIITNINKVRIKSEPLLLKSKLEKLKRFRFIFILRLILIHFQIVL